MVVLVVCVCGRGGGAGDLWADSGGKWVGRGGLTQCATVACRPPGLNHHAIAIAEEPARHAIILVHPTLHPHHPP